jgi:hypothetical protein
MGTAINILRYVPDSATGRDKNDELQHSGDKRIL